MMRVTVLALVIFGHACGGYKGSPLVVAARDGKVAEVRSLLAEGADPNLPDGGNGWPPLMHAIHKNQRTTALALLDGGARATGPEGARALAMAAGYGDAPMVRELLRRGAEPRLAPSGTDALMVDAVGGRWDIDYSWSGCEGHTEVVRLLLEADPTLRLPDSIFGKLAARQARDEGCSALLALVER